MYAKKKRVESTCGKGIQNSPEYLGVLNALLPCPCLKPLGNWKCVESWFVWKLLVSEESEGPICSAFCTFLRIEWSGLRMTRRKHPATAPCTRCLVREIRNESIVCHWIEMAGNLQHPATISRRLIQHAWADVECVTDKNKMSNLGIKWCLMIRVGSKKYQQDGFEKHTISQA